MPTPQSTRHPDSPCTSIRERTLPTPGMEPTRQAVLAGLLGAITITCCSCNVDEFASIGAIDERREAAGVDAIEVETNIGDIRVEYWGQTYVQVHAEVRVPEQDMAALSPAVAQRDLRIEQNDTVLTIANAHLGDRDHNDWRIAFTISVPSMDKVLAQTGIGDVVVKCDCQRAELGTGIGDIEVEGNVAQVSASTGVGDPYLAGTFGTVDIDVGTGDLTIAAQRLDGGTLDCGVGSMQLSSGHGPEADLTCTTGTGDIELSLAQSWAGNFVLESGVGDVGLPDGVSAARDASMVGATVTGSRGTAGPQLTIETGVGSIRWRHRQ